MEAIVHLTDTASVRTNNFRVMEAFGFKNKSLGWRWMLTIEVNGFKITKRSKYPQPNRQAALDNAESEGIEIVYPGV